MNLCSQAITNNELPLFLMGEGKYFVTDRETGEHWFYQNWYKQCLPVLESEGVAYLNQFFLKGLNELLNYPSDKNLALNAIAANLRLYFRDYKKQVILGVPDMRHFSTCFKEVMQMNNEALLKDKRYGGADWYKPNKGMGLWGGIMDILEGIKKFGGSDLIPVEDQNLTPSNQHFYQNSPFLLTHSPPKSYSLVLTK